MHAFVPARLAALFFGCATLITLSPAQQWDASPNALLSPSGTVQGRTAAFEFLICNLFSGDAISRRLAGPGRGGEASSACWQSSEHPSKKDKQLAINEYYAYFY